MTESYLIWSIEHDAWWKPNRYGYTKDISIAGKYSEKEAKEILVHANLVKIQECLIPLSCTIRVERISNSLNFRKL